jgi:hypothetical protein
MSKKKSNQDLANFINSLQFIDSDEVAKINYYYAEEQIRFRGSAFDAANILYNGKNKIAYVELPNGYDRIIVNKCSSNGWIFEILGHNVESKWYHVKYASFYMVNSESHDSSAIIFQTKLNRYSHVFLCTKNLKFDKSDYTHYEMVTDIWRPVAASYLINKLSKFYNVKYTKLTTGIVKQYVQDEVSKTMWSRAINRFLQKYSIEHFKRGPQFFSTLFFEFLGEIGMLERCHIDNEVYSNLINIKSLVNSIKILPYMDNMIKVIYEYNKDSEDTEEHMTNRIIAKRKSLIYVGEAYIRKELHEKNINYEKMAYNLDVSRVITYYSRG